MALELTVQHPDFSYDELGEFSSDEVRQRIIDHTWDAERARFVQQSADTGRACPPSVYAAKSDDYCLHIYATDREGFEVAVLVPRPHKLWGLLRLSTTSSVNSRPLGKAARRDVSKIRTSGGTPSTSE